MKHDKENLAQGRQVDIAGKTVKLLELAQALLRRSRQKGCSRRNPSVANPSRLGAARCIFARVCRRTPALAFFDRRKIRELGTRQMA